MQLIKDFWNNRSLMWNFAKNDFKMRYSGSIFGVMWSFVQPLMMILTLWFVFQVGFRTPSMADVPFILWLATGMIPWFFFSDAWSNAGACFLEYSYLIKKVIFKVSLLPVIKIISSVFIHLAFILLLVVIYAVYGHYPKLIWIQMLYYSFCMAILVLALSYITASIVPFFKDISNIVSVVLQFGMWLTPIMWSTTMVPEKYQMFFKINPMYYVVEGYRDTLINNVWFWHRYNQTAWFWVVTFCLFILGKFIYKKLKPHFADVL